MKDSERSLLIVVPRTGQDAGRSLLQVFGEDPAVQVIVDRRVNDRRVRSGAYGPDRRTGDRRHRLDADSELRGDRWIAIPRTISQIDFGDLDAKAILLPLLDTEGSNELPTVPLSGGRLTSAVVLASTLRT